MLCLGRSNFQTPFGGIWLMLLEGVMFEGDCTAEYPRGDVSPELFGDINDPP